MIKEMFKKWLKKLFQKQSKKRIDKRFEKIGERGKAVEKMDEQWSKSNKNQVKKWWKRYSTKRSK